MLQRKCVKITPLASSVPVPGGTPTLAWRNGNGCIDLMDPSYGRDLQFVPIGSVPAALAAIGSQVKQQQLYLSQPFLPHPHSACMENLNAWCMCGVS
eukprot:COSAG05_NODE_723_length_7727_cov_19.327871_5_plen_97_part_00